MSNTFTAIDTITLIIALIGAILGIINTWRSIERDRIKFKVSPKVSLPALTSYGQEGNLLITDHEKREIPKDISNFKVAIEVINQSAFAISISEAGILYKDKKERGVMIDVTTSEGKPLPIRIEPRHSITIYSHQGFLGDIPKEEKVICAYVQTSCNKMQTGKSKAFMHYANKEN